MNKQEVSPAIDKNEIENLDSRIINLDMTI